MEKKSTRQPQQAQEQKKSIDTSVTKPWPRNSKKRENSNNVPGRNDNGRKSTPKGKSFDKRPRPRGTQQEGHYMAGTTRAGLNDCDAEVGSVFLPGSKKQNLNHLINFQYTPRRGEGGSGRPHSRKFHGLVYTNTHRHNSEMFLQSNCQFVVKAVGDFKANLVDPDIPVNWDLVEQINVRVCEPLTCPICLSELVAGRITRCGHAYCWPCLLHYFALSEDSQRPCPICFQPIDKTRLKSVQGVWQEKVQSDGEITMTLMRRAQGTTVIEPVPELDTEGNHTSPREVLSISHMGTTLFAKLLTADEKEVSKIIERERYELSNQLLVEVDNPENCFIQQALNLLQTRECVSVPEEKLVTCENNLLVVDKKCVFTPPSASGGLDFVSDFNDLEITEPNESNNNETPVQEIATNEIINTATDQPETCVQISCGNPQVSNDDDPYKFFYFYQAYDGQAIFLEGLEVRMLEMSWGGLKYAPRTLKGKVLRRTSGSVSDEARRRLRCLRHLPIHCPYDVVQIELKTPLVSSNVLISFKNELEERKRQRQRRAREEKRLERVVSRQEQKLMGQTCGLQLHLDSDVHFPMYQPDTVDPLNVEHFPPYTGEETNEEDDTPTSSISEPSNTNLSFAKMASTSGAWKTRPPEIVTSPAPVHTMKNDSESDAEGGAGGAPSYNVSLSEAISAAMLSSESKSGEREATQGKKKKHKAKVLFTTGIRHHNMNN